MSVMAFNLIVILVLPPLVFLLLEDCNIKLKTGKEPEFKKQRPSESFQTAFL